MMEIMIKLILQTTQLTRDISSIVFDVFLVPVASKFVLHATQQGGPICSCHFGGWARPRSSSDLCLCCSAHLPCGARWCYECGRREPDQLGDVHYPEEVRVGSYVQSGQDVQPGVQKLILAFGPGPEAPAIRSRCLEVASAEWDWKQGRPPAGNLERKLGSWLQQTVGKCSLSRCEILQHRGPAMRDLSQGAAPVARSSLLHAASAIIADPTKIRTMNWQAILSSEYVKKHLLHLLS